LNIAPEIHCLWRPKGHCFI
jgi:hypothetical protein